MKPVHSTQALRKGGGNLAAGLLCSALLTSASLAQEDPRPVSDAKDGHTAEEAYKYRSEYNYDKILNTESGFQVGDANVYYNLHWEDIRPVNIVRRAGPVWELPLAVDPSIGEIEVTSENGSITVEAFVNDELSRLQGLVVVHEGQIIYENYPGMRPNDNHIWYSVSKTLPAMVLTMMEAQGKLSFDDPVETYIPEMKGTNWEGIPVRDVMDMASGMDIEERFDTILNPEHKVHHYFKISLGGEVPKEDGSPLTVDDVIYSLDKTGEPGEIFEYSSLNTRVVTMLTEHVGGQKFAELLSEYIWQFIGAEGDGYLGVNPSGGAAAGGMMNSRLRDLARYGLFFTPSGDARYGEQVREHLGISTLALPDRITDCRTDLYTAAQTKFNETPDQSGFFGPNDPDAICNSLQWDSIYNDGDFFKAGVGGQGLYISPGKDLVVAYFSTSNGDWERVARAIANSLQN